jgi:hypothetical protein
MEKVFNKPMERSFAPAIYASQGLYQFKKQLLEELLVAIKNNSSGVAKKWHKAHEVRRLLKISLWHLQKT